MSEITLCGYCVELPEKTRAAARQSSRCPLCKAELGVTRGGKRFRITDALSVPRRRSRLPLVVIVVAIAAPVGLLAWLTTRSHRPAEVVAAPPPPAKLEAVAVAEAAPPPADEPVETAVAKRYVLGALSPDPRAKAEPGSFADAPSRLESALGSAAAKREADLPVVAPRRVAVVRVPSALASYWNSQTLLRHGEDALLAVPELALSTEFDGKDAKGAKDKIAKLAKDILAANAKERDGFILSLRKERGDLAGMPFLLGKDCDLSKEQAIVLAQAAGAIRTALGRILQPASSRSAQPTFYYGAPEAFWAALSQARYQQRVERDVLGDPSLLPALVQILGPEAPQFRLGLIARYREAKQPEVTRALTRLAIYDPDPSVRSVALQAVENRPAKESTDLLLEALRYPWAPVAQRAADALVVLDRQDTVPQLVAMLDAPDPAQPVEQAINGKKVLAVRELVKVNHHKNCLLCHAPVTVAGARTARDAPLAVVPSPGEELPPPLSTAYYASRSGAAVVRADVTYLRQDFSMLLAVKDAKPWPERQRFDFLVRTRVLNDAERQALLQRQQAGGPASMSPQRHALLSALRALTRIDAGDNAAAWRQALAQSQR